MCNPRKLFLSNMLVMVTFRTEDGLPFVPLKFINKIIWSALARGYELYDVEVCGVTFEPNHVHMIIRVTDPEAVSSFVKHVKQETAHCINRLLGRRQKTIWAEGFDSPTILDSEAALKKIAYVLLNPMKDGLVSKMEEYPGVSSYSMLMDERFEYKTERIFRDSVIRVKNPTKPWLEEYSYRFNEERESEAIFRINPYSWKKCFDDTKHLSDQQIRVKMLEVLKSEQAKIETKVCNPLRLKKQSLLAEYQPKKFGKRMICLATTAKVRKKFIRIYRHLCNLATKAFLSWKLGHLVPFPSGLFPPNLPRLSNLITKRVLN